MCQTACTSADFSFHGLIQNKNRFAFFASIIYVTSLCCHSISLFQFHLSNSPIYVVIFLNFVFLLPPFYFATVFRPFISPLYFAFLFRQSFFPFYFILPSIFALLIYFAILSSPFYFISPFFSPFYFVFSFIFSNANSFPHFYIRSTFKYILAHGDEYTTTTLHTFHDS